MPDAWGTGFAGVFGLLLGVGFLKFGNPVILDRMVDMPRDWDEWRVFAWPVRIGYAGLFLTSLLALPVIRSQWRPRAPLWLAGSLLAWWAWVALSATRSTDPATTAAILPHLTACIVCFGLGHLALARVSETRVFWLCLVLGFVGVLGVALDQRFGGLEATRRMILEQGDPANLPPEYLARIRSGRLFGTLVYPNALAGLVLLVLPVSMYWCGPWSGLWGPRRRSAWIVTLGFAGVALAVLVWSGSKAGWLLAMGAGMAVLLHAPLGRVWKAGALIVLFAGGLGGFGWLYAEKLGRGATSVAARFDYWRAASQGAMERPWLGQGPGAFKRYYARVKAPESEMAQLAHNDYLQQASDSGIPAALGYLTFVFASLGLTYSRWRRFPMSLAGAVWLGVATWFLQGMVEFGLYLPATSWCAFALLGWLVAQTPFRSETPALS